MVDKVEGSLRLIVFTLMVTVWGLRIPNSVSKASNLIMFPRNNCAWTSFKDSGISVSLPTPFSTKEHTCNISFSVRE